MCGDAHLAAAAPRAAYGEAPAARPRRAAQVLKARLKSQCVRLQPCSRRPNLLCLRRFEAKHAFGAVCALTSPPTGFPTCGMNAQACLADAPVRPREEPRMDQTVQTRSSVPVRGIGEDDC